MPLDPQARELLDFLAKARSTPIERLPVDEARKLALRGLSGSARPVESIKDFEAVPGVTVRVYRPASRDALPTFVYLHGGGWVLGDLDCVNETCQRLANETPCIVVSVGYRLAPEYKFPTPLEDCLAAVRWTADAAPRIGGNASGLVIGGESAGGNLAACTALAIRDRGGPTLSGQLLIYPVTDFRFDTPSYEAFATGYALDRSAMRWYWDHYLANDEDGNSPLASPLRAPDLSGLPPAVVLTAEYDPLRDEGETYAARLAEGGTPVEMRRYSGQIHGFFQLGGVIAAGAAAVGDAARDLRRLFGASD